MQIEREHAARFTRMPLGRYLALRVAHGLAPLWLHLGALESRLLVRRLREAGPIDRPIYVCGLARAGTTITLELLSRHADVASHRYRDMVQPFVPYAWNWLAERLPLPRDHAADRVHQDGILVTRESPEAVEEAIWMRFFPGLHDEGRRAVLDEATRHPAFEACYAATIAKLLLVRQRTRYLSKANYNLTRLAYIARLFPTARFIVVLREPQAHFASWLKQHELLREVQLRDARWRRAIELVGHHEFGLGQRFVHTGHAARMRQIRTAWDQGRRAQAFGLYWSAMHDHVLDLAERDPTLRSAIHFVRHEDLCARPRQAIDAMLSHAALDAGSFRAIRDEYATKLKAPRYYTATLTAAEQADIEATTADTRRRLATLC